MRIGSNESVEVGDDNEFYSFFTTMHESKAFASILLVFYPSFEHRVPSVSSRAHFPMSSSPFDTIITHLPESTDQAYDVTSTVTPPPLTRFVACCAAKTGEGRRFVWICG